MTHPQDGRNGHSPQHDGRPPGPVERTIRHALDKVSGRGVALVVLAGGLLALAATAPPMATATVATAVAGALAALVRARR